MLEDNSDNKRSSPEKNPPGDHLDPAAGSSPDREIIAVISTSLSTIREKIDKAYNHICMDLPEINIEIYRTFQQAIDTLDSLSARGSANSIETIVEEIENNLQGILLRIRHLKNYDSKILEILKQSEGYIQHVQGILNTPEGEIPDHGYRGRTQEYMNKRSSLTLSLQDSLSAEDNTMNEISSRISQDVRSLEYSLSSAVIILKDLISRSGTMKGPILKIMSGLQTHDIVNQDIDTIFRSLKIIHSLMEEKGDESPSLSLLHFQTKASFLSRELILQLFDVIRRHGINLEQEIEDIEDMVSQVKEDKDAIGEFLLLNRSGKSTFDIVINEVSDMFHDLYGKIEALWRLKETQQESINQFCISSNDLEQYVTSNASRGLPQGTLDNILKITSPFKSQERMIKYGSGINDLKDDLGMINSTSRSTRKNLEDIKDLLIGSIKGIDTYSGRCLDAILRFKHDIRNLMTTIDGSDHIIDNLINLDSYLASILDRIPAYEPGSQDDSFTQEMRDILRRLETPHSNSLAEHDEDDLDMGLTLF